MDQVQSEINTEESESYRYRNALIRPPKTFKKPKKPTKAEKFNKKKHEFLVENFTQWQKLRSKIWMENGIWDLIFKIYL